MEFEYRAGNFIQHGHSVLDCDFIVCWENDLGDFILPVIELRSSTWRNDIASIVLPNPQERELAYWKLEAAKWKNRAIAAGNGDGTPLQRVRYMRARQSPDNLPEWHEEVRRMKKLGMSVSRIARKVGRNYYDTLAVVDATHEDEN